MKRIARTLGALLLVCAMLLPLAGCSGGSDGGEVRVYNWGDYIDPAVIDLFEEETGISVVYDTFETNEDMYLKIKNSTGYTYDVAIPSDYMISKMLREEMLAPINFDNVPNFAGVDERFKNPDYDPTNAYTVPYTWGTVCIVYDPEQVKEPVTSWDILWDEDYARKIFMINSERDSIGIALMSLGYSLNSTNASELAEARQKLLDQKPLVLAYTGDDAKDKMIAREGAMAVIWSCDIGLIREEDDTLAYAIPETGTNIWYDSAVILKNSENKENAEAFINFLCRPDIAQLNADYLGALSPVVEAAEQQDDLIKNDPCANPSQEMMDKSEVFLMVDGAAELYSQIWTDVLAS